MKRREWVWPRIAVLSFLVAAVYYSCFLSKKPIFGGRPDSVRSAAFNKRFLVSDLGAHHARFQIDLFSSPQLAASIFPGYGLTMLADSRLWRNYFSREFETRVTSAALSQGSPYGLTVHVSWTGCLDILKTYGADILIVGASDVAQEIPPDELAQYFPGQRILMCASPSLTLGAVKDFLAIVAELPLAAKVKFTIFGFSPTISYIPSLYYPAIDSLKVQTLRDYQKSRFLGEWSFLMNPVRIPYTWEDFLPGPKDHGHLPLPDRLARVEQNQNLGRWSVFNFLVSPEILANPQKIAQLRRELKQEPYYFAGDQDPTCARSQELGDIFLALNASALKISDNTLFYMTPTMGDELKKAPSCYLPLLKKSILNLASPTTLALVTDFSAFGLEAQDFAFVEPWNGQIRYRLDMVHPNYLGAKKIVRSLSQALMARYPR